jgi:hypothetical protein
MSEPVAPAARKAAEQSNSGLATAADASSRRAIAARPGVAVAAVLAIVLLVAVAAALAWRPAERSPAWGAAGVAASVLLGAAALWLLQRLVQDARRDSQALGAFAQRLRKGDVAGALRAVRADSARSRSGARLGARQGAHQGASPVPRCRHPRSSTSRHMKSKSPWVRASSAGRRACACRPTGIGRPTATCS